MQIGKDLLTLVEGSIHGERVMEKDGLWLWTFLQEAAALLSLVLLVATIMTWAVAIGPPY
jgi:hypothetical protein